VTSVLPELVLGEWEHRTPHDAPCLQGRTLDDPHVAGLAERLEGLRALRITEGRHGLRVQSFQHVGVTRLGGLRIRILPKVPTTTLWRLMAYGLGLDDVPRLPPADLQLEGSYPDLLAAMLLVEAERLWRRGLARGYVRAHDWLTSPRGRPDLATLSQHLPLTRAALPCHHHPFTADIVLNQAVLAALDLAGRLASSMRLRSALHRTRQQWSLVCSMRAATRELLDRADDARTHLTAHYAPAHRLARALVEGDGPHDELERGPLALPGALWDMAVLFERAVARFLTEHLPAPWRVQTQHKLRELFSVSGGRRAPTPRPDLVVSRHDAPFAVLDTKYRDLSRTSLPRDILYQLSVYSLAFGGQRPLPAIVLYAVPSGGRRDVTYTLHVHGGVDRTIILRSVSLDALVQGLDEQARGERMALDLLTP